MHTDGHSKVDCSYKGQATQQVRGYAWSLGLESEEVRTEGSSHVVAFGPHCPKKLHSPLTIYQVRSVGRQMHPRDAYNKVTRAAHRCRVQLLCCRVQSDRLFKNATSQIQISGCEGTEDRSSDSTPVRSQDCGRELVQPHVHTHTNAHALACLRTPANRGS